MYAQDWNTCTFSEYVAMGALCKCTLAVERIHQHMFFSSFFHLYELNLSFKSLIIMIEPI